MNSEIPIFDLTAREGRSNLRHVGKFERNPFVDAMIVKTKRRRLTVARGSSLVDLDTGEIEGITEIAQVVFMEESQFVKVYAQDLASWFDLSKTAIRVFGYVLETTQQEAIGRDLLWLDYKSERAAKYKFSRQTYYRGLEELVSKGFLAKHMSAGWYFINPNLFFNGDRARFIKEYRKEPKQIKQNQQDLETKSTSEKIEKAIPSQTDLLLEIQL